MNPSREQMPREGVPVLNYADPGLGQLVVIAIFPDEIEARMAACKLQGEQIRAIVEDRVPIFSGRSSARLKVFADDAAKAIEILKATPARVCLVGKAE